MSARLGTHAELLEKWSAVRDAVSTPLPYVCGEKKERRAVREGESIAEGRGAQALEKRLSRDDVVKVF